jgi:diguanylate cyclase (GGDEF)-like protein
VSFRGRLTLFLVLIVVVPMVVIAVLATRVADDASTGKADARLFAGIETANALYEREQADSKAAAEAIGADQALANALRTGDSASIRAAAAAAARSEGAESMIVLSPDDAVLARVGGEQFASAEVTLTGEGGGEAATLEASATSKLSYLEDVRQLTGREPAVYAGTDATARLLGGERVDVPGSGGQDVEVGGTDQRMLTGSLPGDSDLRIALVGPPEEGGFLSSSPAVIAGLVAFFALAFFLALGVMRALSGQVAAMLDAARGIGEGDFSREVPVVGRDEMAGLADEFNKMSVQLKAQMDQLRRQQMEIDRSVRRIGEAFASGLDRQGLLQIVAETAVSACQAEYGLIALSGREGAEVSSGRAGEGIEDVVLAAEAEATRADKLIAHSHELAHALSAPLRRIGDPGHDLGVMTVARTTRPFNETERDVFLYLIGQASASIENVALHELVSEQAVTDELTGLSNKRAFTDVAYKEAARAERFSHPLSLLMLDIDDFKKVNDTYGHLQGDEVLRRIGRILQSESRGIDEPARYGGEEFAVALPETGTEGAFGLAERVRERIEREEVPFLDGDGVLRITASVGVATLPEAAADVQGLIAAADGALYAAKRGGKNRVEIAPGRGEAPDRRQASADGASAQGRTPARRN